MWTPPPRKPATQAMYDAADQALPPEARRFDVDAIIAAVRPSLPNLVEEPTGWKSRCAAMSMHSTPKQG